MICSWVCYFITCSINIATILWLFTAYRCLLNCWCDDRIRMPLHIWSSQSGEQGREVPGVGLQLGLIIYSCKPTYISQICTHIVVLYYSVMRNKQAKGQDTSKSVNPGSSRIVICKLDACTDTIEVTSYLPPTVAFPMNSTVICYHNPIYSLRVGTDQYGVG